MNLHIKLSIFFNIKLDIVRESINKMWYLIWTLIRSYKVAILARSLFHLLLTYQERRKNQALPILFPASCLKTANELVIQLVSRMAGAVIVAIYANCRRVATTVATYQYTEI